MDKIKTIRKICNGCSKTFYTLKDDVYCNQCGMKLIEDKEYKCKCGRILMPHYKYCPSCGTETGIK